MSQKFETIDAVMCSDCVVVSANGIEEGQEFEFEPLSKLYANESVSLNIDENGDSSPFFSWHGCDGCNTNLGGDRYECTILRTV